MKAAIVDTFLWHLAFQFENHLLQKNGKILQHLLRRLSLYKITDPLILSTDRKRDNSLTACSKLSGFNIIYIQNLEVIFKCYY